MSQILYTCITTKFRVCRVCTKYIILMYAIYQTIASDLILSLNISKGVLKRGNLLYGSKYNQMTSKLYINSARRIYNIELSISFYVFFYVVHYITGHLSKSTACFATPQYFFNFLKKYLHIYVRYCFRTYPNIVILFWSQLQHYIDQGYIQICNQSLEQKYIGISIV